VTQGIIAAIVKFAIGAAWYQPLLTATGVRCACNSACFKSLR